MRNLSSITNQNEQSLQNLHSIISIQSNSILNLQNSISSLNNNIISIERQLLSIQRSMNIRNRTSSRPYTLPTFSNISSRSNLFSNLNPSSPNQSPQNDSTQTPFSPHIFMSSLNTPTNTTSNTTSNNTTNTTSNIPSSNLSSNPLNTALDNIIFRSLVEALDRDRPSNTNPTTNPTTNPNLIEVSFSTETVPSNIVDMIRSYNENNTPENVITTHSTISNNTEVYIYKNDSIIELEEVYTETDNIDINDESNISSGESNLSRGESNNNLNDLESNSDNDRLSCVICQDTIQDNSIVRKIKKCGHVFHMSCLDKWLENRITCPTCRTDIRIQSNQNETEAETVN